MHSNLVIAETIKPTSKQSTCMIDCDGNFDSNFNNNMEFIDVDLPCNKLSVQLLANDSATQIKKKCAVES